MNLDEWRAKRADGEIFETPSGLAIKLRALSLMDLAVRGDVPAALTTMVNQVLDKGLGMITVETAGEFETVLNLVVKAAVIDPPLADERTEAALGVRELPIIDRMAIFRQCNRYVDALKPFRSE